MSDEISQSVDLFGNRVFFGGRARGRPAFERTDENSHKVSMLLAMGWSNGRIASVIRDPRTGKSISEPTLKRYFRSELKTRDHARDMLRSKQMMQAYAAADGGNVGAMRFFDQLIEKNDMMLAEDRVGKRSSVAEPKDEKTTVLGKKDMQKLQADDAESRLLEKIKGEAGASRPN